MTHTIEPAASGRSKCRGCGNSIAKGELRFGERLPNPFADGDMTIWFHLNCAALKRPESLAEILDETPEVDNRERLGEYIEQGVRFHRLPRIRGAEKAPSGRARCRECREAILKNEWRIPLVIFEEGMFNAAGNIHMKCAGAYFETTDILHIVRHFAPSLDAEEVQEIQVLLAEQ